MFHARVLLVLCLVSSNAIAQEAPAGVPAPVVAVATPDQESFDMMAAMMKAMEKAGTPDDFTWQTLATWTFYVVVVVGVGYLSFRYRDDPDMKQFLLDAGAAADHVYIEKIEGSDKKLDGKSLREAGMLFLSDMKGPTVRIIAKKGKPWVMSQIHRIANKKKAEGADLKIKKAKVAESGISSDTAS